MKRIITTAMLVAAGISVSACNVSTGTALKIKEDDYNYAHYQNDNSDEKGLPGSSAGDTVKVAASTSGASSGSFASTSTGGGASSAMSSGGGASSEMSSGGTLAQSLGSSGGSGQPSGGTSDRAPVSGNSQASRSAGSFSAAPDNEDAGKEADPSQPENGGVDDDRSATHNGSLDKDGAAAAEQARNETDKDASGSGEAIEDTHTAPSNTEPQPGDETPLDKD